MTTFSPGDKVTREHHSDIFKIIHIDGKWAWMRKDGLGPHGSGYLATVDSLTKYQPPKPKWKAGRIYRNKASASCIRVHAVGAAGAVGFRLDHNGNSKSPWLSHTDEQGDIWEEVVQTATRIEWTIP